MSFRMYKTITKSFKQTDNKDSWFPQRKTSIFSLTKFYLNGKNDLSLLAFMYIPRCILLSMSIWCSPIPLLLLSCLLLNLLKEDSISFKSYFFILNSSLDHYRNCLWKTPQKNNRFRSSNYLNLSLCINQLFAPL